ncbi:hypothetical protein LEP1GSC038_0601 [Leptospira weilii str. 2006001855]|uniref:Uncharacterized protein n=1 Tax=Leptospira weilii str. 2006001855 TaxID=996804 RepID=M6FLC1_9LEPT|nr:hypothetical protein LEP1GSC038_0601 [Leptospira weilii str. 2006001855]
MQQEQKEFGFRVSVFGEVTGQKEPKQANVEIRGIFHLFKILKFVTILIFERSGSRVGSNLSQNLKRKNVKGSYRNRRLTFVG